MNQCKTEIQKINFDIDYNFIQPNELLCSSYSEIDELDKPDWQYFESFFLKDIDVNNILKEKHESLHKLNSDSYEYKYVSDYFFNIDTIECLKTCIKKNEDTLEEFESRLEESKLPERKKLTKKIEELIEQIKRNKDDLSRKLDPIKE